MIILNSSLLLSRDKWTDGHMIITGLSHEDVCFRWAINDTAEQMDYILWKARHLVGEKGVVLTGLANCPWSVW